MDKNDVLNMSISNDIRIKMIQFALQIKEKKMMHIKYFYHNTIFWYRLESDI